MKALRIGMVDLDTSHPASWLPVIRELGHEVIGVYDGGTVYPDGYAQTFAAERGIERVFSSLDEMAEAVDAAIIHSCNWDLHIARARPFIEAGKGVLVDKPLSGNVSDLLQLLEWEKQGSRIIGGSSLRYCREVAGWNATHDPKQVMYAHAGCSVDEFNYGIHAYTLLHGLLGPGIQSVRYLGTRIQHLIEISWNDGRLGTVGVGTAGPIPFFATIVSESGVSHIEVNRSSLYRSFLGQALPYLAGEQPAPFTMASIIEVELAAIAAKLSRESGGSRVFLQDIPLTYAGYDGSLFARVYKMNRFNI